MEYASRAVGNAGLTTGIIGTAGFGLSLLGSLLGGMNPAAVAAASTPSCSENTGVNRFELEQAQTMANKDMEIACWRGQDETNRKISDAYSKLESRIIELSGVVRANKDEQAGINLQQAVYNGTNTAAVGCIQEQINTLKDLTKTVVPNSSVCPGWGDATVTVSTSTATA